MYRVLTSAPQTARTDEIAFTVEGKPSYFHRITGWRELGTATDMDDAKRKFGGRPALEWIGRTH